LAKTKEKMVNIETIINNKCENLSKDQIKVEFDGWLSDLGYFRTRDTRIFRETKLY